MKFSVTIGGVVFPNPVTVASGTFGYAEKYYRASEIKKFGALIPKTITLHAREGNPPPRIHETASGMINAIGIENPGADVFIREKLPPLQKLGVPLIISILGHSDEEFAELSRRFKGQQGVAVLELNLSCPNLGQKRLVAQDPAATERIIRKVKQVTGIPVLAKLTPNVTDITEIARAAEAGGADGLCLVNTYAAMAVDITTRRPVLGNISGGLSGPAIKPAALKMVYDAARSVSIPVVGMGGIMTAEDALEFMIAGATMVAVGTANFINPSAPLDILDGIKKYMRKNKIEDVRELIGSIQ